MRGVKNAEPFSRESSDDLDDLGRGIDAHDVAGADPLEERGIDSGHDRDLGRHRPLYHHRVRLAEDEAERADPQTSHREEGPATGDAALYRRAHENPPGERLPVQGVSRT